MKAHNTQGESADIYSRITNQLIDAIEATPGKFELPWHKCNLMPVNAISGKAYRGINLLTLMIAADKAGYNSEVWATYQQWLQAGAQVRKGEKATPIVFWKFIDSKVEIEHDSDDEPKRIPLARTYFVFNANQVDGYNFQVTPDYPQLSQAARIAEAEKFLAATSADVRFGGNRAYYSPDTDHIQMPHFEQFKSADAFYATIFHETCHWTSAQNRCNRNLAGRFGSEAYAAEELIAELGAAFLCAILGISNEPREDHAQYLANWLTVLRNDKKAIFTAAAKAQAAVDWLVEHCSKRCAA